MPSDVFLRYGNAVLIRFPELYLLMDIDMMQTQTTCLHGLL